MRSDTPGLISVSNNVRREIKKGAGLSSGSSGAVHEVHCHLINFFDISMVVFFNFFFLTLLSYISCTH